MKFTEISNLAMVFSISFIMLTVVLYSEKDRTWKLTDFGLTCEGATHGSHTTEFARGTPGYRSPELLLEGRHVFTNKVDIWAMGVILHELVTGKQPFPTDAAVLEHYRSKQLIKLRLNEGFDERCKTTIYTCMMDMLQQKAEFRPTATALVQKFTEYHNATVALENAALATRAEHVVSSSSPNGEFKTPLKRQFDDSLADDGAIPKKSRPSFGPDHPETLRLHHQLATIYQKLGRYQEAAELWEDTVKRRTHILGPDHSDTRSSQDRLMFTYGSLRQHQEATEMCKEIVRRNRITLGIDNPDTLASQHDLAIIYANLGRYQDAAELYEDTVKHRKIKLGADHPDTLSSQYNLIMVYTNLGRHEEAAELENSLKRSRLKTGYQLR
jgi:serine/threonine protein kinase